MAKKQLTAEQTSQIEEDLQSKLSGKRRSAAKKIGKNHLVELSDKLYEAYLKEREDKRTWETQTEMIMALGRIGCTKSLPDLKTIIDRNEPHDMITIAAARSYVRLKRKDLSDALPVIELIKTGNLSVLNGATDVLSYDNMQLAEEDIKTIISILDSKDEKEISVRGLGDPRTGLISAMHNWHDATSRSYLQRISQSDNKILKNCADLALKGKKSVLE